MTQDEKALLEAYTRGRVEAANFLRDTFAHESNEAARLACSNYAAIVQVNGGLATWEQLRAQGSSDLIE